MSKKTSWHLTPQGDINPCKAKIKCRYGDTAPHVNAESQSEAIQAFNERAEKENSNDRLGMGFSFTLGPDGPSQDNRARYSLVSPRDVAEQIREMEKSAGRHLDNISLKGTVRLYDDVPEIRISREYKRNSKGDYFPKWHLEREFMGKTIRREIDPYGIANKGTRLDDIRHFLDHDKAPGEFGYGTDADIPMKFGIANSPEKLLMVEERKEETLNFLYNVIGGIEASIELSQTQDRKHHRIAARPDSLLENDPDGKAIGSINYSSTAWRPHFFRNADTGESRTNFFKLKLNSSSHFRKTGKAKLDKEYAETRREIDGEVKGMRYSKRPFTGISEGFAVFEKYAGEGAAEWSITRVQEGWKVKIRGTRGETKTIIAQTPEEVQEHVEKFFNKKVKLRSNRNAARRRGLRVTEINKALPETSTTAEKLASSRTGFITDLISEGNLFEERAKKDQSELKEIEAEWDHFVETGELRKELYEDSSSKRFWQRF